jgi:hypothetical protein
MVLAKNTVKQVVVIGRPPLVTVSVYQGLIDHDPMLGNKKAIKWAGSAGGCRQDSRGPRAALLVATKK